MEKTNYAKLSSAQIVSILFDSRTRWIEASLNDGMFNATHILLLYKNKLIDCGIDSRNVKWKPKIFIDFYKDACWKIDQISKRLIH